MVTSAEYGNYETAWCPGCGNFAILESVKKALVKCALEPHQVLFVSGIGQAAKSPHYMNVNLFDGLHGRSLPVATGAKLANKNLAVIVESGDGCSYGEGGNHFLAALRRNVDITMIVHNNQVYGLTKGQASPTSEEGFVTKAQPGGVYSEPMHPLTIAVAMHAGFVARSFSGMPDLTTDLIAQGINHKGFSLIDILQPCVSFNKLNNFAWYKNRCYELSNDYDPTNWEAAIKKASEWGEKIPVGVIYKNTTRMCFEDHFQALKDKNLIDIEVSKEELRKIMETFK